MQLAISDQEELRGGEITLVKQLAKEGKSDIEIDFELLSYGSDEVSQFMHDAAMQKAKLSQHVADSIDQAVANGETVPKKYIEQSIELHKNANFIKKALKKIFPNIK